MATNLCACLTLGCVCMIGCFSCVQHFVTLWTAASQAPLSMGFPRQEHWSGLPCPFLPDPRIEPVSPALQVDSLPTEWLGKPNTCPTMLPTLNHFLPKPWNITGYKLIGRWFYWLPASGHHWSTGQWHLTCLSSASNLLLGFPPRLWPS